ncbi:DUF2268 domain-containing putative Zn-dependent protease [Agrilutibacter solisilvae]|uniref:Lytic murein transglycosylase n=1 Tax=Agrilutibacter solisilvae TaxID=2763317 RepID=A0A974Y5G1_9GAMM|nr:DUF2268 domain-containing putative Zn-dependent protease [Lysobacter solisilvae]QSX78691.1 lytic murein transglycosylase [Lysobacter solisilvae]
MRRNSMEAANVSDGSTCQPLSSTRRVSAFTAALAAVTVLASCAPTAQSTRPVGSARPVHEPVIEIDDVARFYRLYDATAGQPTAEQLQQYIDGGSPGLRVFAEQRRTTGVRIAEAIAKTPATFAQARRCADALPRVRERLGDAMAELGRLYPAARFPPVTIAVGRGRPVGIGSPVTGVQIGLEALCATDFLNPDVEDRFVHVIAHEFVHVQQATEMTDAKNPTVLEASLMEGSAEFATELISGSVAYAYLPALVAGREAQIETRFVADQAKTDLSDWIGNSTPEQPGELGYWVGYRIAKAYYQRAPDKREALREILQMRDAPAFLAASGWHPRKVKPKSTQTSNAPPRATHGEEPKNP